MPIFCGPYMSLHFEPPDVSLAFCGFSISAIISSKALETFELSRALASVKLQRNSSASLAPSGAGTCLCSGFRSLLLPTITSGTQSAPCFCDQTQRPSSGIRPRMKPISMERASYQMIENLVPDNTNHLKCLARCDRVNEHVAMYTNEMLRVQQAIFILVL